MVPYVKSSFLLLFTVISKKPKSVDCYQSWQRLLIFSTRGPYMLNKFSICVIQEQKRQLASVSMGLKMNKSVKSVFFQIRSVSKCVFFLCEDRTNVNISEKAQSPNLFNCLSMITHSKRRKVWRKIRDVLTSKHE